MEFACIEADNCKAATCAPLVSTTTRLKCGTAMAVPAVPVAPGLQ